jgi:zinc transporter ZupT
MLFLRSGSVELQKDGKVFKTLEEGTVVGEIALITETPRTMTVKALGEVEVLVLRKEDFDHLRKQLPELDKAAREMASERLEQISAHQREQSEEQEEWIQQTADALRTGAVIPSSEDLKHEVEAHHGAPLAIWMGILLDGIPESFVIGAGFLFLLVNKSAGGVIDQIGLADAIPYTLVAGLFLSNFPEALSSSAGMKAQGWSKKRILFLWFILMVFTSLGAALGYFAGASVAGETIALIEGIAAGAMLTMIASAMIPEAVHMGGANNVGLSTLLGFLAAISFKLLE